jgi:type I restriction enzyme, S subunit
MLEDHGQYKVYGQENVITNDFTRGDRFISMSKFRELSVYEIRPGDILITMMGTSGRCAIVPKTVMPGIMDSHLLRIRARGIMPRFLRLQIDESDHVLHQLQMLGKGSIMHGLNSSVIKELWVTVPPLRDEEHILACLDRETAKLDTLIAKQERLIELLEEKRQTVISHAVTKGLNPNAPMKDSGVEWLREVPAHWTVTILKRLSTLHRGYDLTEIERDVGPYPVVTSGGIAGNHSVFMAKGPGVVTGRYGSTGTFFYIDQDYWPHNTTLFVSDFHGNHPRYVWYALQTVDFEGYSAKAAVPGIDRNDLHTIEVAVPPVLEQIAVAGFLDRQTALMDHLVAKAQRFIDLMREHRTALISAAITGKIDVRSHVPKAVPDTLMFAAT